MNDIILSMQNGEPVVSSRQIAESFEKRHDHVMRDIEDIMRGLPKNGDTPMFYKTEYVHEQNGQSYPMYLMNRDGFTLLAMGFNGKAALEWKLKYIAAFNEMEKKLAEQPQLTRSQLLATALIAAHEELEEKDKRIAELTPDAEFARAVCIADNCRTATSIAKDYGLTAEKLNKLLYSSLFSTKTAMVSGCCTNPIRVRATPRTARARPFSALTARLTFQIQRSGRSRVKSSSMSNSRSLASRRESRSGLLQNSKISEDGRTEHGEDYHLEGRP